jgi:hypothetical protein
MVAITINNPETLVMFNHLCKLGYYHRDDKTDNAKHKMAKDFFINYLKLFRLFMDQYNDYTNAIEAGNVTKKNDIERLIHNVADEAVSKIILYYVEYTDDIIHINNLDLNKKQLIEYLVMSLDEFKNRFMQSILYNITGFDDGFVNLLVYGMRDIDLVYANQMTIVLEIKTKDDGYAQVN